MPRLLAALALLLSAVLPFSPAAAQDEDVSKPLLLVAQPSLRGPYSHTALLVVPLGDKHIGFILNRATGTRMGTAFPDHAPSQKVVDPIYFGGPEASDALFAVVPHDPGEASIRLFGDLYMTGNRKSIDRIIEQTPNEARYFAGFVGWMPQELEKEIAAGLWLVGEPDAKEVFRKDTKGMWQELVERLGAGKPHRPGPGEREARNGTRLAAMRG